MINCLPFCIDDMNGVLLFGLVFAVSCGILFVLKLKQEGYLNISQKESTK